MPYLQGIKQRSRHAHMQATVCSLYVTNRARESVRANAMHVSVRSTALLRERESERGTATARVSTMFGPLRYSPCSAVQFERRSREVDRTQPLHSLGISRSSHCVFFDLFFGCVSFLFIYFFSVYFFCCGYTCIFLLMTPKQH